MKNHIGEVGGKPGESGKWGPKSHMKKSLSRSVCYAGEMAQWIRVHPALSEDRSSIPRTHTE